PGGVMSSPEQMVNVRYMVDDVQAAIGFYTGHLGFTLRSSAAPAFADVTPGNLRLLLAGPARPGGAAGAPVRQAGPPPGGPAPHAGGKGGGRRAPGRARGGEPGPP